MGTLATYKPLYVWCSPASIPQIVAHIQDYLVKNPIVSTETVAEIVVQSLQEHPELINGAVIPITEDSAQTIKEYIDALPSFDGYTKAETDALLLLKQNLLTWDQTPTVGSSNPVTSEGIKAAISASAAALADLISTKADIASVYTKATTDALLLQKADAATTYSKNAVNALLDTKVDINDTYTRADIDLMKQVDKANTAIVTDGTAPFNIAAGQYVYVNDILYMATEPITENDPLVPGTNIALTPKGVTNVIGDGLQNLARTVSTQSDQIGDVALPTTAQTLTGAIAEDHDKIEALGPYAGLDSNSNSIALSASMGLALSNFIAIDQYSESGDLRTYMYNKYKEKPKLLYCSSAAGGKPGNSGGYALSFCKNNLWSRIIFFDALSASTIHTCVYNPTSGTWGSWTAI